MSRERGAGSGTDLVCVDVRCTGGEHIVMRAVSRMTHGRVTIASEKPSESAGIYWITVVVILYS